MTTGTSRHGTAQTSHEHINQLRAAQVQQERRRKRRIRLVSVGASVALIDAQLAPGDLLHDASRP
jgi:hypothetical protein